MGKTIGGNFLGLEADEKGNVLYGGAVSVIVLNPEEKDRQKWILKRVATKDLRPCQGEN